MNAIPLVRVRYADSFAKELERLGAPIERLLNRVDLSEEILSFRDGFMPVNQLWRFTALAAHYTGIWEMGLRAGMTPLAEHSRFGQHLLFAPTLYQAMTLFCAMAPTELTTAEFRIRQGRGLAWFCGGPVHGSDEEIRQVELYRIGMMVQVIRWAAGGNWQPPEVRLQSQTATRLWNTDLIQGVGVRLGCPEPAVGVPLALLGQPLQRPSGPARPAPATLSEPQLNFKSSIKEIIRTRVRGRRGTIRDVARSLDMSVRTLQRRLSGHGLEFSRLVDQTRIEIATAMLKETNSPIRDIAEEVGYSEPTHFSRAFKRITGNSPSQYRSHLRFATQQ